MHLQIFVTFLIVIFVLLQWPRTAVISKVCRYMIFWKKQNYKDRKQMSGKAWHWEKLTTKGQKGTLLGEG